MKLALDRWTMLMSTLAGMIDDEQQSDRLFQEAVGLIKETLTASSISHDETSRLMGSLESIAHRYATAVLQRNKPDEAEAVYRDFISTARANHCWKYAANAALRLGALMQQNKNWDEAQDVPGGSSWSNLRRTSNRTNVKCLRISSNLDLPGSTKQIQIPIKPYWSIMTPCKALADLLTQVITNEKPMTAASSDDAKEVAQQFVRAVR